MKQRHLRIVRIILAVVFLLLISTVFVDFRELIPTRVTRKILFLQFVPSVIKFIAVPALAYTGFVFVLILTALFGRVYCSAICPLGILQDIFSRTSRTLRLVKRYKFKKAWDFLRYPLLGLVVVSLFFGSLFLLNLLDPYSLFGRMFSDLVRPGLMTVNNGVSVLLEKFEIYFLFRLDMHLITWRTVGIPIAFLALVIWMSLKYGRLYCNAVCPVGTFLGLLSRISLFRIRIDAVTCSRCGKCSFACKSSCINIKTQKVDVSRCVACYNCISVCPEDSIRYEPVLFRRKLQPEEPLQTEITRNSKREFVGKLLFYFLALTGLSKRGLAIVKSTDRPAGHIPNNKTHPVSPPGSVSLSHFQDHCTACHLCVSICPTRVLQPSFLEYGLTGIMQPRMDYNVEYCNFECTKCGEVCPTGAILPLKVQDKKLEQIGQVKFIKEKCIVYTDNTACGSCSEHCPTQAVHMVPYEGNLTIPEIKPEVCIGCGACEFACPVKPYTSIFVDGNAVHAVAQKPKEEKLKVDSNEAFPF